jgi:hypothetical protein
MFAQSSERDPLTQGDVIEDCPLVGLNLAVRPLDLSDPPTKWWTTRVIVLTQACDLAQGKIESVLVARAGRNGRAEGNGHTRSYAPPSGFWLVFPASSDGAGHYAGIASRPARHPFGSACRAGAINRHAQTDRQLGVALPRAPGAAFRRHLHACGLAATIRDATLRRLDRK